eukprot:GFUD01037790.1.p1 GENE.GFUD01037790.1~~GFUD01037790.1.p1  ORF type:complete len:382 (+),score=173.03 GFUD01037790.1:97-1146(+)
MSDDEYYEEETLSKRSNTSAKGDEAFAKKKSGLKKSELDEQLKEYISEWRKTREKEEEELKRLKDKQAKRKEIRAEQEKKLSQQKKEEEEKIRKEENDKKAAEAEEKKKRLEEAEAKRQQMLESQKAKGGNKKSGAGHDVSDSRREMSKTKEQLEEEKKIALSIRIKPLDLESLDSDELRSKANDLFNIVVQLETDKYDFEQRTVTQDYELKELKERQKVQLRQKAMKKGLDPEALTGKHPPKIRMYSKYERRTDTRTYEDRKTLYEGGWEVMRGETLDAMWKEKYEEWNKRTKSRLPKWFGERPGKKAGDPETPEGDEDAVGGAEEEEEEFEEEEEEEEEEDEDEYED